MNPEVGSKAAEAIGGGIFGLIVASCVESWQLMVVIAIMYGITLFGNLATGILYAKQSKTYSSDVAMKAVYKKAAMIIGILVVFAVDLIVMALARSGGIVYSIPFFGCIIAGYSAVHEFISMLENLKKLGNKVPAVLDDAAHKAEDALNQGKIPDVKELTGNGSSKPQ